MTKHIAKIFLRQYLYFLSLPVIFRILFFSVYFDKAAKAGFGDIISSFWYAWPLDNSATAYIMILPFFLLLIYSVFPAKPVMTINKYYSFLIAVVLIIIETANIAIYNEWGMKLNYKALTYITEPSEALHSAQPFELIAGFSLIAILSFLYIRFGLKLRIFEHKRLKPDYRFAAGWFIIMPFLIFGSMRGSLQQIPISQSESYHSKSNFVNLGSVNTAWNLGHSILQNRIFLDKNPFLYFPLDKAKERVAKLYDFPKNDSLKILTTDNPNVVLIFLESWSGNFIDELGSDLHITKGFSKLIKDGYFFTNCYASGMLSHQGLSAVLSANPSTPFVSLIKQPAKYHGLKCIINNFKERKYHTSFLFGGQLNYGNIKAYIYYNGFDEITEGKDFPYDVPEGSLGHHDQYMFEHLINDINGYQQPFFAGAFTLSSHSPFDMPVNDYVDFGGSFNKMLNSIYYSDSCLYNFVSQAKKQPWFDNTLFIFVADHGHPSPYKYPYYSKEIRRIPLLFYGNVIKKEYRGKKNNTLMSQTDIAATLLAQLGMDYSDFKWSKNVLNPNVKKFAYYGFDNGYGWIEPDGYYSYLKTQERMMDNRFKPKADTSRIIKNGKAFVEVLYQEYLDL